MTVCSSTCEKQGRRLRMVIGGGLKWAARTLIVFILLTLAAWSISRWLGPTDAQEAALATMRELPPLKGKNAFGALWLLPYDVPVSERDKILAEDARRFSAIPTRAMDASAADRVFSSSALERYPDQSPSQADLSLFCSYRDDCIHKVSADHEKYDALVRRHGALLDRIETLSDFDGLRHLMGQRVFDAAVPSYGYAVLPATRYALQFSRGMEFEAFDGTCGAISTWRKLSAGSDLLISRLSGAAFSGEFYTRLFASMLAKVPRDFVLPPSCGPAFTAPSPDELSMCRTMQGEFAFMMAAAETSITARPPLRHSVHRWFFRAASTPEMLEGEVAHALAYYCSAAADRAMADDVPFVRPSTQDGWLRLQCIGNKESCLLIDIDAQQLQAFSGRIQDANAKLRLIAILLRLRAEAVGQSVSEETLRKAFAQAGDVSRNVGISSSGRTLKMRNYENSRDDYWEIPLPPYLRQSSSADASR